MALGRPVDIAINHDPDAILMHKTNHPDTLHLTEDIFKVNLKKYVKGQHVALMWASPDCTSHSKAKGGKPREKGLRILPWAVYKHAKEILPDVVLMENVEEIQQEEKKHNGNDIFHIKEKIYEMILYGNPQLKDFPKTERYVLAGDIRKTMYTMLEMAVRLEKKYHKKTTLQDLDIEVDVLRNLLRLAKDPNLYPNQKPCLNFHTWEVWMRKVDEIGRMIGGYSEWVNSRERQK